MVVTPPSKLGGALAAKLDRDFLLTFYAYWSEHEAISGPIALASDHLHLTTSLSDFYETVSDRLTHRTRQLPDATSQMQ